jgi:predicted ATPase
MPLSREVRRLERSWQNGTAWPKRLDWVEIENIRGWQGQRIRFPFPIVAISGENGSGKSTIIQACAAVYQRYQSKGSVKQKGTKYASDFFLIPFGMR